MKPELYTLCGTVLLILHREENRVVYMVTGHGKSTTRACDGDPACGSYWESYGWIRVPD